MTIVVTGATGSFGRLAIDALLRRGIPAGQIIAVDGGRSLRRAMFPGQVRDDFLIRFTGTHLSSPACREL